MNTDVVLKLSCVDRPGIVATVAGFLADRGFTIRDSQQFGDEDTGLFFMRVHAGSIDDVKVDELRTAFEEVSIHCSWPVSASLIFIKPTGGNSSTRRS